MSNDAEPRRWIKADLGSRDIAHYIADTVRELLPLARRVEARDLAYLLDLTLAEAEFVAKLPDESKK